MENEQRFRPAGVLPGRLYIPGGGGPKKHPCRECFACQWCADSRCEACRRCRDRGAGSPEGDQATKR
ncbi:MAG: hypothetical protein Kow0054_06300 [Deferrisoma sp.]